MDSTEDNILDERRQAIFDALKLHNEVVAGCYKSAIRALKTPAYIGEERARVATIGNAMREVINTLPIIMGKNNEGSKSDTNKLVRELPEKLSQFSDLDLKQDIDYIPIPRQAAILISEIVTAASQDTMSIRENAAALLAEGTPSDHPAIKQWLDANKFFTGCTHLGRPPRGLSEDMSDENIEKNIRIVEDLIEVRTRGFFDSQHEIKSILDSINSSGDDENE